MPRLSIGRFHLRLVWVVALFSLVAVHSFQISPGAPRATRQRVGPLLATSTTKATLTEATTWNLRLVVSGITTAKGKTLNNQVFSMEAHFVEEEGYEPPQGSLRPVNDDQALKITKSYWKLSEDPNDRRDGLWVWGLFEEPLYPFMLLQLETAAMETGDEDDTILPLKLYAQIDHQRDPETGVVLNGNELQLREAETIQADLFGAATVDIAKDTTVGRISIRPL